MTKMDDPATTDRFETIASDFANDFAALRGDVSKLSNLVAGLVGDQASMAGDRVLGVMDDARAGISARASDAQDRARAAGEQVEAVINRNPLTAVLVAVTAGLVIGMLSQVRR